MENVAQAKLAMAIKDHGALGSLLMVYRPLLRAAASQALNNGLRRREDESDIVQKTLFEAHKDFAHFEGNSIPQFSAWLNCIFTNNLKNVFRDQHAARRDIRREVQLGRDGSSLSIVWHGPAARGASPSGVLIHEEEAVLLASAIEQLATEQRRAVTLRYLFGASLQEICDDMGRSRASVAGLLRRGLEELRANKRIMAIGLS